MQTYKVKPCFLVASRCQIEVNKRNRGQLNWMHMSQIVDFSVHYRSLSHVLRQNPPDFGVISEQKPCTKIIYTVLQTSVGLF